MTVKQMQFLLDCVSYALDDGYRIPDKEEAQIIQQMYAQLSDMQSAVYDEQQELLRKRQQ